VAEARSVEGVSEEDDVGREAATGQKNLEGSLHRHGEPDGSRQRQEGKDEEADSLCG